MSSKTRCHLNWESATQHQFLQKVLGLLLNLPHAHVLGMKLWKFSKVFIRQEGCWGNIDMSSPAAPCGLSSTWGCSDWGWKVSRHFFHFLFDFNLTNQNHSRSQKKSLQTKIHSALADNQHLKLPGIFREIQLWNAKLKTKATKKALIFYPIPFVLVVGWFIGILMMAH